MAAIISTIDQLKKTVKVNAKTPFEAVEPFLQSARDIYLVRYLGAELVELLEDDEAPERVTMLHALVCKALGPLAVWMGNAELSVRISDSGFTVAKQDGASGYVPASDTKIAKVGESLERRGFQYLDQVLEFLEVNAANFPEWTNSNNYKIRNANYILHGSQYSLTGVVGALDNTWLQLEDLRHKMEQLEAQYITPLLGLTLDIALRAAMIAEPTPLQLSLIWTIRKFIACKVQETPYFEEKALFHFNSLRLLLMQNATALGIAPATEAPEFNADDKRIFNMGG